MHPIHQWFLIFVRRAETKLTQGQKIVRISDWLLMVIVFVAIWRHKSGSNDGLHWARGSALSEVPWLRNSPAGFSLMGKGEGVLGFFAIFLVSGFLELAWREDPAGEREPGNYGDPFGVQMYNDEMRMKELNNGRMAMISVLGIFAAELATGKDAMQQFGLPALGGGRFVSSSSRTSFAGKTSLRANAQQSVMRRAEAVVAEDVPPPFQPSEQFGATEPLGFFDPLGFTAVGDERGFRKLRVSEIKHGRVARLHFELWKTSE